jgi:hypothetical protein
MQIKSESSKKIYGFPASLPVRQVSMGPEVCFLLLAQEARIVEHFCGTRHLRNVYQVTRKEEGFSSAVLVPWYDFEQLAKGYPEAERFLKFKMPEKPVEGYVVISEEDYRRWWNVDKWRVSNVTLLPGATLGSVTPSLERNHRERRLKEQHLISATTDIYGCPRLLLTGFVNFDNLSSAARFLAGSPQAGWTYFNSIVDHR